ncbi:hypothetical protein VTO42DRAFT_1329 [Malbranchea cinnamomea]
MDIKPSNIVLDREGNAILIDVGGMGITRSWLAPEMELKEWPIDTPSQMRLPNEVWAYGKLLLGIATRLDGNPFSSSLRQVAKDLMQKDPASRISLSEATLQSISSSSKPPLVLSPA